MADGKWQAFQCWGLLSGLVSVVKKLAFLHHFHVLLGGESPQSQGLICGSMVNASTKDLTKIYHSEMTC